MNNLRLLFFAWKAAFTRLDMKIESRLVKHKKKIRVLLLNKLWLTGLYIKILEKAEPKNFEATAKAANRPYGQSKYHFSCWRGRIILAEWGGHLCRSRFDSWPHNPLCGGITMMGVKTSGFCWWHTLYSGRRWNCYQNLSMPHPGHIKSIFPSFERSIIP